MRDFVRVMKAMSDMSRVSILMMLRRREMCACEITPLLGLAQPTVSRHLKVLKDAGLVLTRREGIWINYRLPEEPESLFAAALLNGLPCWLGEDPELRAMLERMGPDNPCAVTNCEAIACGKPQGQGRRDRVAGQAAAQPNRHLEVAVMTQNTAMLDSPERRELAVLWQRLVVGGSTCERCGDTGDAVRQAVAELAEELAPRGIAVRVEEKALPPFAVSESNRVFFNGEPMEALLGAQAGMSRCQSCCDLMADEIQGKAQGQAQGQTGCRTLIVDGQEHEALSEELLLRAGRIAAQLLMAKHKETI